MTDKPLTLAEALAVIEAEITPSPDTETIPLAKASGRIAANNITAKLQVPRYPNSAVDGYGFRYADLHDGTVTMAIAGVAKAGHPYTGELPPKTALRIFTGAPVANAQIDTIIMQEDTQADEKQVAFETSKIQQGQNLRDAGDDVNVGDNLIQQGMKINPAHIGLLSAQGLQKIAVYKKIKVALLSTGDELCDPTKKLKDAMIYDSNRPMLKELLQADGYEVKDFGIIPDNPKTLLQKLKSKCDVIVTSAAMSQGVEDHLRKLIMQHGKLLFGNLKCKPGRPAGVGVINNKPIIALPGNPVAAFAIYAMLGRAVLTKMSGANYKPPQQFPVTLGESFNKKQGRREFVRASLKRQGDSYLALRYGKKGAGILSSVASCDGFIVFSEDDGDKQAGDSAQFIPIAELI